MFGARGRRGLRSTCFKFLREGLGRNWKCGNALCFPELRKLFWAGHPSTIEDPWVQWGRAERRALQKPMKWRNSMVVRHSMKLRDW